MNTLTMDKFSAQNQIKSKNESKILRDKFENIAKNKDTKALEKAASEFEEIFINLVLKTMRNSVPKSDFFGNSMQKEIYEGMLDEELSKSLASRGVFGLRDLIKSSFEKDFEKIKKYDN